MSEIQTNFRAVDMLGTAKPVVTAPKKAAKKVEAPKPEPEAVVVVEDDFVAPEAVEAE